MVERQINENGTMDASEADESTQSIIDKANAAAERLETATKRAEEIARLQAENAIKERLEGKSNAGMPNKPAEETPQQYAQRVLRGEV